MDDDDDYQSFIKVANKDGSDDFMELPREKDGSVLLSTVQAQFPGAIGLKYRSSSGGWRGVRSEDNVLQSPSSGWGETIYVVTESGAPKGKSSREDSGRGEKRRRSSKLLDDLIVFGLPFTTTDEELRDYFEGCCGELAFYEIKYDRQTKRSRGFGFIRFKTEEAAKEALRGYHEVQGRKLAIKVSEKKLTPIKLFVGRIPRGATHQEVKDYFGEFGDLEDVFVPAGRGFAFITYASEEDGKGALRMSHVFQGARLNVTIAEPKAEERPRQDRVHEERSSYTWNRDNDRTRDRSRDRSKERYDKYSSDRRSERRRDRSNDRGTDRGNDRGRRGERSIDRRHSASANAAGYNKTLYEQEDRHRSRNPPQAPPVPQNDLANELKTMLFTLLTGQK